MSQDGEKPQQQQPQQPQQQASKSKFEVEPGDVVLFGSTIIAAVGGLTAAATYKAGTKSLVEDGINPSARVQAVPLALKTLLLSTLFTGCLGWAGFHALNAAGFFSSTKTELPTMQEMAKYARRPMLLIKELEGNAAEGPSQSQSQGERGVGPALVLDSAERA